MGPGQVKETYKYIITQRGEVWFLRDIYKLCWELVGKWEKWGQFPREKDLWAGILHTSRKFPVRQERHKGNFLYQRNSGSCGTTRSKSFIYPFSLSPILQTSQENFLPLLLSILFCAQNRTQPWKLQQNAVVSSPSCAGDREHQGFKLNFQRAWVMEMTPDHPGIPLGL